MKKELKQQVGKIGELTDAELAILEENLVSEAEEIAETSNTTELEEIAESVKVVRAERSKRERDAEQVRERVDELMADIKPAAPTAHEEPPAPTDPETPAEETPAEPETPAPADPEIPAVETVETPIAVAATATPMPKPPHEAKPKPSESNPALVITAAADLPRIPTGAEIELPQVHEAFADRAEAAMSGPGGKYAVATMRQDHEEDRQLGYDAFENMQKVAAVASQEAITAAGGTCAPTVPRYDLPGIGTDERPVKAALPGFGAPRGGVNWITPISFATRDLSTGITVVEEAEDVANKTKGCYTVVCGDPESIKLGAIAQCMTIGNFNREFYPELGNALWRELGILYSRTAENRLWDTMCTGSVAVTTARTFGTFRDVITKVALAAANMRSRFRTLADFPLRFGAPAYLRDMMAVDLYRQAPGDDEIGEAYADIDEAFAEFNIRPFWSLDGGGQVLPGQGGGPVAGWPLHVETLLFPEGYWVYLGGPSIDFGMVIRDSVLNPQNKVQSMLESFEHVAHFGPGQSYCMTMALCQDGSTGGPSDADPCSTGS